MNRESKFYKIGFAASAVLLFVVSAMWTPTSGSLKRDSAVVEKKKKRPDHPFEAMKFRRLQMQDEKGVIPVDGLEKARQQVKLMRAGVKTGSKALGGIEPDSWSWLGPGNIGGRIRSIVIHPTITDRMWVGSVTGGIWRTDNGGTSWFPVNDFMANLAVSTMVINPAAPSTMYAGTGEIVGSQNTQGAGIFNSTDSGLTWNQLPSTNPGLATVCPNPATPANCPWLYVNRLAISRDGNTILAATGNNIQHSTNAGVSWTVGGGVVGTLLDIDFHPTNSQQAIAGGNGAAVFSINAGQPMPTWTFSQFSTDGGVSFSPISGRVELAYAPSNPTIVYASVNQNNGDIFRSTNGGVSFARVNTGLSFFNGGNGNQGGYDNIIWVNPQDPTMVIVGGIDLWRSTNSGINFTRISRWQSAPAASAHADHHMIVAHPGFNNTTNRTAFFGNDGGIYRSDDVSAAVPPDPPEATTISFVALNNNLGITQFYGAAGNFINDTFGNPSPVIVGGTQDNGTLVYTGATNWVIGKGGDGGYCAADPTEQYYYGEYVYLTIYRSIDSSPYINIYTNIEDAGDQSPNPQKANFIAPFILDPSNPNTMLAGGISLWRSTNVKGSIPLWNRIWGPTGDNSPISAIAVHPLASDIICVGHNNGDIYHTSNGTNALPSWFKIDRANLPNNRMVTRLAIDNNRLPYWIYATFGGFSGDNVYRTTDLGATWTDITGTGLTGLPNVPVRSLVYHPQNPNLLYVGTEVGIFSSDDAGATWDVTQGGPANVSVDELFWLGGDLIAATHGRGLYKAAGGIYVDCNYNGPQLGTFNQPYKTVTAAINALTTNQPIWIKPCTYFEPINTRIFNKRFELRSLGGTAVIRSP
jgi:hypothetical protein